MVTRTSKTAGLSVVKVLLFQGVVAKSLVVFVSQRRSTLDMLLPRQENFIDYFADRTQRWWRFSKAVIARSTVCLRLISVSCHERPRVRSFGLGPSRQ